MTHGKNSFWSGWHERLAALGQIPPVLEIVWESGPAVVASGIIVRVFSALLPVALLAVSWHSFRRPTLVYGGYQFISTPAPLFVHQFSHAWFDFRGKQDEYADYFANSVPATQAHRQFCQSLRERFPSYSPELWGITASDSVKGYVAWGGPPLQGPVDGSIVPAAAGSLPFVFADSMAVLRNLRERYGFVDAFKPLTGWVDHEVVGIDQSISMVMAENARSEFVWRTFIRNPEMQAAMDKAGFRPLRTPATLYSMQGSPAAHS